MNELEERFKTLEEEYSQIMEERKIAREKREAQERELQMVFFVLFLVGGASINHCS